MKQKIRRLSTLILLVLIMISALPAQALMIQYERENIEVLITEALEGYKDKYDLSFDSTIGKLVVTTTAEYTKIMSQKLTKYGVNMNVVNMQTIQIPKPKEITSDEGRTIATGNVTVRSGPGTGFKKLGMLKKGRGVSVINANSGWAKIEFGAGHGYVSTTYLNLFHNVEDYAPMIGVASRTASVRSGSSTKNKVVFTFEKGKAVVVVSISGKWAKVNYGFANMKAGYIQVSDLWFNTK